MIYKDIENFSHQFFYEPEIKNGKFIERKKFKSFVVVGMGGSALAARLLSLWGGSCNVIVHSDYGLPNLSYQKLENSLIILNSYSGNTEEVIEGFKIARKNKLQMAVIAAGGRLLSLAKKNNIPYIELPNKKIQPRMALGYSFLALTKLLKRKEIFQEAANLKTSLKPQILQSAGDLLAKEIKNSIPIIYSSSKNASLAYVWKIKFNETAKTPAFTNVFPEINHNELAGFDSSFGEKQLQKFYFIFLTDSSDSSRIKKRMRLTRNILQDAGLRIREIELKGKTTSEKVFSSIVLADWTTFYLAKEKKVDPERVAIIEKFKELMRN